MFQVGFRSGSGKIWVGFGHFSWGWVSGVMKWLSFYLGFLGFSIKETKIHVRLGIRVSFFKVGMGLGKLGFTSQVFADT